MPLGFYSYSIESIGFRDITFSDLKEYKKTNKVIIDNYTREAESDYAAGMGPDSYNYWSVVQEKYENSTLNAVYLKKKTSCKNKVAIVDANSLEEIANNVFNGAKNAVPANQEPVFMWSEKLAKGAYCGPQYNEWDNEENSDFTLYTARATKYDINSDEYMP